MTYIQILRNCRRRSEGRLGFFYSRQLLREALWGLKRKRTATPYNHYWRLRKNKKPKDATTQTEFEYIEEDEPEQVEEVQPQEEENRLPQGDIFYFGIKPFYV